MKDYKKILEGIVNIVNAIENSDIGFDTIRAYISENCPELKESEDERIRKAILNYLTKMWGNSQDDVCGVNVEDAIAWLEHQGDYSKLVEEIKKRKELFSKEKENATSDNDKLSLGGRIAMLEELLVFVNEKQGEPVDKVEPKFHEGDWVVSPNGVYWHIDKISNNRYEVTSNTGESSSWNLDTNIYHKFNIQDAKDGDVLATDDWVFIFKKLNTDGKPVCYCHYDIELGFHIDVNTYISTGSYIRPATREQRDTLMKAMADSGYIFDFDKKELKRIKQKTAEEYNITGIHSKHAEGKLGEMIKNLKSVNEMKVEPKFKVKYAGSEYNVLEVKDIAGVTFYGIEDEPNHIDYIKAENCERVEDEIEIPYGSKDSELQEATYYIPKGFYAEIDDDKVVIKKDEKPAEWSEKHIADVFEKVGLAKIVREQSNDALTIALQDAMIELSKVILQPNPTAWSEEDERICRAIINDIANDKSMCKYEISKGICDEQINWLKSLKDRYTWKPSEEQMIALRQTISGCSYDVEPLLELEKQLKKL